MKLMGKVSEFKLPDLSNQKQPKTDSETFATDGDRATVDACIEGLNGLFSPLSNDFRSQLDSEIVANKFFSNDPTWNYDRRVEVQKFRFVMATLGLAGLSLAVMARMVLNVGIVEMVVPQQVLNQTSSLSTTEATMIESATTETFDAFTTTRPPDSSLDHPTYPGRFNWTTGDKNFILGSFYIGYAPAMIISGNIADRFGSRFPMLFAILGTAIINLLTPFLAYWNFEALIGSRITLGLAQGALVPALYDFFNKWLTATETSIFAPLLKVALALGALTGVALPGVVAWLGLQWPAMFYATGVLCLIWSFIWFPLATSDPKDNKRVNEGELNKIMRKKVKKEKPVEISMISNAVDDKIKLVVDTNSRRANANALANVSSSTSTPWLKILTNPSVLALTFVKFTYNIGVDFISLQLALYMSSIYQASTETISLIASCCCFLQMTLVAFIGVCAKEVVQRETFGLSRTKWRKIFQGLSNLGMGLIYIIIASIDPNMWIVTSLLLIACMLWMLGAGGESMAPYDLSTRFPATIYGFAHSISILSGIALPIVSTSILGQDSTDPASWRILFWLIGSCLVVGGLVFVLVFKSKPFLPGEKQPKESRH